MSTFTTDCLYFQVWQHYTGKTAGCGYENDILIAAFLSAEEAEWYCQQRNCPEWVYYTKDRRTGKVAK